MIKSDLFYAESWLGFMNNAYNLYNASSMQSKLKDAGHEHQHNADIYVLSHSLCRALHPQQETT